MIPAKTPDEILSILMEEFRVLHESGMDLPVDSLQLREMQVFKTEDRLETMRRLRLWSLGEGSRHVVGEII